MPWIGGINNLDGLATTTNFETQPKYGIDNFDKEEPMEVGKVSKVKDEKCYHCQEKGHYARQCKKTGEMASQDSKAE